MASRRSDANIDATLLIAETALGMREGRRAREAKSRHWLKQNTKAIGAYNARIERDGLWSDGLRSF
jgi:post-segregation antitoxin (ccd killing protein)